MTGHRHRRQIAMLVLLAVACAGTRPDGRVLPPLRAQDRPAPASAGERDGGSIESVMLARVEAASDRGFAYLAARQRKDGGWQNNHAVNALALLAFLARGHTPGRGPYRDVLEKGKRYILGTANTDNGYLSFGTMYEHGLATLALAELYGMDPDPELEAKLRKAVDLIVGVQSPAGGWNYAPSEGDGDLSVSVMQIVAMRAAHNAMIPVPPDSIRKAVAYVRGKANTGGPGYGYNVPGPGTPQTSAAGCLSLQLLGAHDDPQVARTLDHLAKERVAWGNDGPTYFYYFHYYAMQAFYQAGGKNWNEWHPKVRELLLKHQNADGSWDVPPLTAEMEGVVGGNRIYWTSMAVLILQIYEHFLPAYQR